MVELEHDQVVVKSVEKADFTINFYADGIAEIIWRSGLEMVEQEHLKSLKEELGHLNHGLPVGVYISTLDFLNTTDEAKQYGASEEASEFTLANAVLIDNLGKRILFNFFVRFNKPVRPTKGFSTREKAFEWLRANFL